MTVAARNELVIEGVVVRVEAGRFTPAGLAATHLALRHQPHPDRAETGAEFDVEVVAYGDLAQSMQDLSPGDAILIKGRLQRKHRRSMALAIQANQFKFASKG